MSDSLPAELERLLSAPDKQVDVAWASFLSTYSPLLLHAARTAALSYDDGMDGYAHVLEGLRANDCRRLRGYRPDPRTKFSTWLVLVARRMCVDMRRARYGRVDLAAPATDAEVEQRSARRRLVDLTAAEIDLSTLEDGSSGAEGELRTNELKDLLSSVISELPSSDQLLVTLRFADGLPVKEIAAILSMPTPMHVYRRIAQITAGLKLALERRGVDDPVP
ncbi:MAG TPA: sigma-70 family RNA polymerase sigma factor [Gemmatimonadaceae bacterium]|nr:sigma-70 family RNA polymerase sigma factor [Gemmatimonadaceae bacterium]